MTSAAGQRIGWRRRVRIGAKTTEVHVVAPDMPEAQAEPAPIHAKPRLVDSADWRKGGGKVILFSDGTSQDCGCLSEVDFGWRAESG